MVTLLLSAILKALGNCSFTFLFFDKFVKKMAATMPSKPAKARPMMVFRLDELKPGAEEGVSPLFTAAFTFTGILGG